MFDGEVEHGAAYILVDDHVELGGTLANLRGNVEARGASFIAITTLTESRDAKRILLRPEARSMALQRGEIRWSDRARDWDVLIPLVAFKNAGCSFYAGKPFRLVLPDLNRLYGYLDAYVRTHRQALLGGPATPAHSSFRRQRQRARTPPMRPSRARQEEGWHPPLVVSSRRCAPRERWR